MVFIQEIIYLKDGAYVINCDKYKSIGIYWIALYLNRDNVGSSSNVTYFDRFCVDHIPKEIKKIIGNKNITTNSVTKQAFNSIMCRYFFMGFSDFMFKGKSVLDYTN